MNSIKSFELKLLMVLNISILYKYKNNTIKQKLELE